MLVENLGVFDCFEGLGHVGARLGERLHMATGTPLRAFGASLRRDDRRPQQTQKYDEPPAHKKKGEGSSSCESVAYTTDRNPASRPGSQDRWSARKTKSSLNRTKRFLGTQPSTGLARLQRLIRRSDGGEGAKVAITFRYFDLAHTRAPSPIEVRVRGRLPLI